mmetsp:Transcript_29625/g.72744  ORF Transcript_29625/g.72744 Transcript_29625/m.72744 type:complete len:216 (+) Transcript_29625:674-1321(+)
MALLPERMQRLRHPRQRMLSICRDLVPVLLHVQQDALQDREPRLYDEEDGRFDRHQVEHDASRQQRDAHDDDERVHRVLQHVGEWVVGVPVLDVDRVEELDEKSERDRQAEESTLVLGVECVGGRHGVVERQLDANTDEHDRHRLGLPEEDAKHVVQPPQQQHALRLTQWQHAGAHLGDLLGVRGDRRDERPAACAHRTPLVERSDQLLLVVCLL